MSAVNLSSLSNLVSCRQAHVRHFMGNIFMSDTKHILTVESQHYMMMPCLKTHDVCLLAVEEAPHRAMRQTEVGYGGNLHGTVCET